MSRVGGNAQIKAMKQVAGTLRLDLAQYRNLAAFAQFGSDLDKASQAQLARGQRMVELLKQAQFAPMDVELQVVSIYAGTKGYFDSLKVEAVRDFEKGLHEYLKSEYKETSRRSWPPASSRRPPRRRSSRRSRSSRTAS